MELTKIIFLGLVTSSVARPRTVYRYQGDNAEHWLEGAPGNSVTGFYSWMSPEGLEFYVKYKADENGYRILDSNATPVNHNGVAADGNQVLNVPLEIDMIPISHDGLVVFDSSKTEPEDQAIIGEDNTVPSQYGKNNIVISHDKNELLATSDKQSEESIESDLISIDDNELIEEEQEDSTQPPNVNDSAIVNNMEEASSSFGERTDDLAMVPNAEPIIAEVVAMSNVTEEVSMIDESVPVLLEPIEFVIPMEMKTIQRGGNKRTFAPIKMENGDLTFMELTPVSVSLEGVTISSTTEACDLCEMQYDYDFDDTLRNI